MTDALREPTHGDLDRKLDQAIASANAAEEKAEEAVRIANDNKTRLDEIAGAGNKKTDNDSRRLGGFFIAGSGAASLRRA